MNLWQRLWLKAIDDEEPSLEQWRSLCLCSIALNVFVVVLLLKG